MGDPVDEFATLFRGRLDVFGTDAGGCEKVDPLDLNLTYEKRIYKHLFADTPMGVYPLEGTSVHWGCVDFDEGEEASFIHATNLCTALSAFGIQGWIERSRSKGYHVWVFCDGWVPAVTMRTALMAACQLSDAPTKEVNPKQTELPEGGVGNYVRLPYPMAAANTGRQCVVEDRRNLNLGQFIAAAKQSLVTVEQLDKLALMYVAPAAPVRKVSPYMYDGRPAERRLSGLAFTIYRDGPLDGGDRSGTLFKLACQMAEDGTVTFDEALDLLCEADRRWGKFYLRPNGEQTLAQMLSKAWK